MFKIESYITPILLSYVDKYVKDFKPADAQVSLWGGGVLLQNLVLKTDVLQQEVALPFTLVSGRIHELLIQVPWTKIISEPIIVTIDTIECILNRRPPNDEPKPETDHSESTQVVEAPPGYMQALVRRVVSNIAIKVHHLIVKYVQDDIVLSLNVKELSVNSAGTDWKPAFADIDATNPAIRRLIVLDDLTLCLDSTDSDGKIRFYQDPLLYRCGLEFRVLAKLASPNTRRAKSFEVQMLTSKLAWGITTAQLLLLLRLVKESVPPENETPSPSAAAKSQPPAQSGHPPKSGMAHSEQPSRHESWSDWAWSWMPSTERIQGKSETPIASCPVPVAFSAYLDHVSLAIKTLETEVNNKKRPRSILELTASYLAIKSSICVPTFLRVKIGVRYLELQSIGKCTCGHSNINTVWGDPTIYLSGRSEKDTAWKWPDENIEIELAEIAVEKTKAELGKESNQKPGENPAQESAQTSGKESAETSPKESTEKPKQDAENKSDKEIDKKTDSKVESQSSKEPEKDSGPNAKEQVILPDSEKTEPLQHIRSRLLLKPIAGLEFDQTQMDRRHKLSLDAQEDKFWKKLSPVLSIEIMHERSPPNAYINPYDKPPKNFEYSDWEEQSDIHVQLQPMDLRICMDLIHRLTSLKSIFAEVPPAPIEPMRRLTVEECDALNSNLPQRRTNIEINDFRINLHPWDHSLTDKPSRAPLLLRVEFPKGNVVIATPLYAQRVCSAAGQMPEDTGLLWQASQVHATAALNNITISVCTLSGEQSKPCGRIDVRFVTHSLLFPEYFETKQSILLSYAVKIKEANISGSSARLHAAAEVLTSLLRGTPSTALRQTTMAQDAIDDENLVALDVTAEDLTARGFKTKKVRTTILTLQSLRATVFQSSPDKQLQQAWLFSGPDVPTTTPYIRMACQWCVETFPGSVEFCGFWTEPTALAIDPLLASWLAYQPTSKSSESYPILRKYSSTQSLSRRRSRTTQASSSGRGQSRTSTVDAEQVHKVQSLDSESEKSEKKDTTPDPPPGSKPPEPEWMGQHLLQLHERLKHVLMTVDLGLTLIYVTTKTATAVGCDTVRVAMEHHAAERNCVVVYSVGRWSMLTNTVTRHLWHVIDQNGPTYMKEDGGPAKESFPWKMLLCDMSCYTLEANSPGLGFAAAQAEFSRGLRSQLKATARCQPHTIIELISTNVVLSVVTKTLQHKVIVKPAENEKSKHLKGKEEAKLKYFTSGSDFKPTTFLEFLRGPTSRKRETGTQSVPTEASSHDKYKGPIKQLVPGPIVSLGFNLHADTPPLICRLEREQVQMLVTTLHCLKHVITLLQQNIKEGMQTRPESRPSLNISRSEVDEEETGSTGSVAELITILPTPRYEHQPHGIKTFFWFQWVISRVTTVISADEAKLLVEVDDMSMSLDIQENYDQFKIKIATASIKYLEITEENTFVQSSFGGRVLEVSEPMFAKEDTHFLSVTITRAQISKLPESWKEELHPKLLEQKHRADMMWEIYAVLASLDVVLVPSSLEHIMQFLNLVTANISCSPSMEVTRTTSTFDLPYCYLNAGGLKLALTCDVDRRKIDDTLILNISKTTINPHPENPICRQPITANDSGWNLPGNLEGRQYEIYIKGISIETAQFNQLASKQENIADAKIANENPAVKWSTQVAEPTVNSILQPLEIDLLVAPALFVNGSLVCGAAVELNLTSDCLIELNIDQLILFKAAQKLIRHACRQKLPGLCNIHAGECPYEEYFKNIEVVSSDNLRNISPISSRHMLNEDDNMKAGLALGGGTVDSGMGTTTSRSKSSIYQDTPLKKKPSVIFSERRATRNASDYLEIFLTTGAIELSLYTMNDGTPEVEALKPRKPVPGAAKAEEVEPTEGSRESLGSVTDTRRRNFLQLDLTKSYQKRLLPRINANIVPLVHMTLHQPNLYYWKRQSQKSLQISLFNMWFGLGTVLVDDYWHASILSTARGIPDPETEIPSSLATVKYTSGVLSGLNTSSTSITQRGSLNVDIERPVHIEASKENVRRLAGINKLIQSKLMTHALAVEETARDPMTYKLRHLLITHVIEVVTIQTSQIGLTVGKATMGFDNASLQVFLTPRRDKLDAKGLISALFLTTDDINIKNQRPILHPVHIGLLMNATWEAWRRAEGGSSAKQPSVRVLIEMDSMSVDLCPRNLYIIKNIIELLEDLKEFSKDVKSESSDSEDSFELGQQPTTGKILYARSSFFLPSAASMVDISEGDHYYKDDLRSGAFKITEGPQLPMAYQVTLYKNMISWRYPHPRAIHKIVAFPLPDQDVEVPCVLEFYSLLLNQWEPYITIKLPVSEPRKYMLHSRLPEIVFSTIWRFRVLAEDAEKATYHFNMKKFMPSNDPTGLEYTDPVDNSGTSEVSAELLSGILNVDSYFSPQLTPQAKLILRFGKLDLYLHNSLPKLNKIESYVEGYYASNPLMRTHRTFVLSAENAMIHYGYDSPAGSILLFKTHLMTEILECSTGTMESLTDKFKLQVGLSIPDNTLEKSRVRLCSTRIRTHLHLSRLRTIQALADDWKNAVRQYITLPQSRKSKYSREEPTSILKKEARTATQVLEGRVSLWIHNTCSVALQMGQDHTDEIFPVGPGTKLAYRWRYPDAQKELRFAVASPNTDWMWSTSVTFAVGESRIRLPVGEESNIPGAGVFLYVTVKQIGAHRLMRLSGGLIIANMLKWNLLYKVRAQQIKDNSWATVSSGELSEESIGHSIICSTNKEMVLKIRFLKQDIGWSGDIPLKECPKENVPWLVKVPREGEVPYVSVWCRVVRARTDGRIIAAIWPLYVLRSNLTLDTDVLLETDMGTRTRQTSPEAGVGSNPSSPAPLIQTAPGRGVRSHILAPGTTSAKHSLSFQYRNVECPVTREAVPLHYGVTDTSVFDKRTPINTIEEVLKEIKQWLKTGNQHPDPYWPHSIVSKHWKGSWQPTLLQPRCDVVIRYQAVRVGGGGCSLEMQLNPVLLLCNASPIHVTLRAHDAAPMCKLEPGSIVSPPSIVLQKPFFISMEIGRETFVSRQLEVCSTEPGRYSAPPPGLLVVDQTTTFVIPCHNKVAILNAHYEIKDDFNLIGLTPSFVFVNMLDIDVSISTIALPSLKKGKPCHLPPAPLSLIQSYKPESVEYVPLCQFSLLDRWRGGEVSELAMYLTVVLKSTTSACPVRLGVPPYRKPLDLVDNDGKPLAVVVTQHLHEGRWVVTLSRDPSPQLLVVNRASVAVCIAQPCPTTDHNEQSELKLISECAGVQWNCQLMAGETRYYSCPEHQISQPLSSHQTKPPVLLAFALQMEGGLEPVWFGPVQVSGGEQLVQLSHITTLKLRVRPHPHSTLLELHDVDATDIAASDIRNRLLYGDKMLLTPNNSSEEFVSRRYQADKKLNELILKESEFGFRKLDMQLLEKDLHDFVEKQYEKEAKAQLKSSTIAPTQKLDMQLTKKDLHDFVEKHDEKEAKAQSQSSSIAPTNYQSDIEASTQAQGISVNSSAPPINIKPDSITPEEMSASRKAETDEIKSSTSEIKTTSGDILIQPISSKKVTIIHPDSDNPENKLSKTVIASPRENVRTDAVETIPSKTVTEVPTEATETIATKIVTEAPTETTETIATTTVTEVPTEATETIATKTVTEVPTETTETIPTKTVTEAPTETTETIATKTVTKVPTEPTETIATKTVTEVPTETTETIATKTVPEVPIQTTETIATKTVTEVPTETTETIGTKTVKKVRTETTETIATKTVTKVLTKTTETSATKTVTEVPIQTTETIATKTVTEVPTETTETIGTKTVKKVPTETIETIEANEMVSVADEKKKKPISFAPDLPSPSSNSYVLLQENKYDWDGNAQMDQERIKCMIASVVVEMAAAEDTSPLLAVHVDQTYVMVALFNRTIKTTISITDVQIDNLQYESGQFDFPVIATTRADLPDDDHWPTVWNMFEDTAYSTDNVNSRVTVQTCHDTWTVMSHKYTKLTEIDFRAESLALYVEDAYVAALVKLLKIAVPEKQVDYEAGIIAEARALQNPLQLRLLQIQPMDLTLTLHTAVRMYIALDHSPLHLNAFTLQHMFTSTECLVHALTVHYLSAAILGAGWMVGGLELLGAPGALAARVGGATGGVRGIASTTAAALLRSLSACAGSLARNLDLLAGDEEHAKRAAAARRRPPATFIKGLVAGITNFAINILGAVGGLAHHPLVGVAVGETESSAAALRRSLVGAVTKPLSATADLVAYAGHGLLRQTGWDPVPQARGSSMQREAAYMGWRRDCVRWAFRLAELTPLAGFKVLVDDAPLHLLLTNKLLVLADAEYERVIEMIDLRHCTLLPFLGGTIELCVKNKPQAITEIRTVNDDDEFHINEAAMQRVARYTGAEGGLGGAGGGRGSRGGGGGGGDIRVLRLEAARGQSHALHAALLALVHTNSDTHFPLL